jgi:hypothetical protein
LPIELDHGSAAKTWATAPPLKAVVLISSMVSGAGGGTHEVRAGVAQGLDSPTGTVS